MEIARTWWYGIIDTKSTIKRLSKKKLTFMDGAISVLLLSFILSIIVAIIIGFFMTMVPEANAFAGTGTIAIFLISFIGLSILSIVGLAIFTWAFRKIADKYKGKGTFEKDAGFFGLLSGMMFLVMIPYMAGYLLMMILISTAPLIGFVLFGLGMLIYLAYIGKLGGMMFEILSSIEKVKVHEVGWIQGLTMGVIYFIGVLLFGLLIQIVGMMTPIV